MDDPTLLAQFKSCELPYPTWCHRLHVRLAYLFLQHAPFDDALRSFRAGIQAYNRVHRVPDGMTSGYHETLTVAWLRIVAERIRLMPSRGESEAFCVSNPDLLDKTLLRGFYSRERIVSMEAKHQFVEPDLRPLPGEGAA